MEKQAGVEGDEMIANILCVGDELLSGDTLETNAATLARYLFPFHCAVGEIRVVADTEEIIISTTRELLNSCDVLFTIGGLGPTEDDKTKGAVCAAVGIEELVLHEPSLMQIYEVMGTRSIPSSNLKQAKFPEQATVLRNLLGTAPGMFLPLSSGQVVVTLPGPPSELKHVCAGDLYEMMLAITDKEHLVEQTLFVYGVGESALEEMVMPELLDTAPLRIGTYYDGRSVTLKITCAGEGAEALVEDKKRRLMGRLSDLLVIEDICVEQALHELLISEGQTLSVAESCTGGGLASELTARAGASNFFDMGIVSYSNISKMRLLDVTKQTLTKFGAVSEETAKEMVTGLYQLTKSDICVAITGIAGPDGGQAEKPVGLVYIAYHMADRIHVSKNIWRGSRDRIQKKAISKAYQLIYKKLLANTHE